MNDREMGFAYLGFIIGIVLIISVEIITDYVYNKVNAKDVGEKVCEYFNMKLYEVKRNGFQIEKLVCEDYFGTLLRVVG